MTSNSVGAGRTASSKTVEESTLLEGLDEEAFDELRVDDQYARQDAAMELSARVERAALEYGSSHTGAMKWLMRTVLRLAQECPFAAVREVFQILLQRLQLEPVTALLPKEAGLVCRFLPMDAVPCLEDIDPSHRLLNWFEDLFLICGRVTHLDRVIGLLPDFADAYFASYNFLMREAGPLPLVWRSYIAILAAARFQCAYLVTLMEREFLKSGGTPEWLTDPSVVPTKLRAIFKLNALMAHQPWLFTSEHVAELVKGNEAWSMSELMHCIMVLALFHSLCGLVKGLRILPEIDWIAENEEDEFDVSSDAAETQDTNLQQRQLEATRNLTELLQGHIETLINEQTGADAFDSIVDDVQQNANISDDAGRTPSNAKQTASGILQRCHLYVEGPLADMQYENYDVKSSRYKVFRMQDYNWKDHAYSLIACYYPGIAPLLDQELNIIYTLTDNKVFEERGDIDTGPFRRAIWHYVHRLYGICHDAYNYEEVNVFLNRSIKGFLKKIACLVQPVTQRDVLNIGYNFRPDEVVHITLLAVEAKRRASLLYAMRAITAYTTT